MALERKDLRVYLEQDIHAALSLLADVDRIEMKDLAEQVIRQYVEQRIHDATVIAERAARLGFSRTAPDSAGFGRTGPDCSGFSRTGGGGR